MSTRRRSRIRALVLALSVASGVAAPSIARAAGFHAQVDETRVSVGDTITLSVALDGSENISGANVNPGAGFDVVSSGQRSEISVSGAGMVQRVIFEWVLRAKKPGRYSLSPVFRVNAATQSATPVQVEVTNEPSRRRRATPDPFGMNPFAPFLQDPVEPRVDQREQTFLPDAYTLPAPRGANVFLHATVDKKTAVVGELITHAVYLYDRNTHGDINFNEVHEPAFADFFRRPLLDRKSPAKPLGYANVGGDAWAVKLISKTALFPLRAGKLYVGPMHLGVSGRPTWTRESEKFTIEVTEPPLAGRPPGYTIGDVGQFQLKVKVEPRETRAGGAVAVTAELEGAGNFPAKLEVPETADVHWLEPSTRDSFSTSLDSVQGKRTFSYVVRVAKPGQVALGSIRLSFYDPAARAYQTLREDLGTVTVTGQVQKEAQRDERTLFLESLPPARAESSRVEAKTYLSDHRALPFLCALPPAFLLIGERSWRGLGRLRERMRARAASPERILSERERALKTSDAEPKEKMALAYALVEHAYRMSTGDSLRGAAAASLGEDPELARWVSDYEAQRYAPEGPTAENAADIAQRALALAKRWRKA